MDNHTLYILSLRNDLRAKGYDARVANSDCFDIHQDGRVHYLSNCEAKALLAATHATPLDLTEHSEWHGLNFWYTFGEQS